MPPLARAVMLAFKYWSWVSIQGAAMAEDTPKLTPNAIRDSENLLLMVMGKSYLARPLQQNLEQTAKHHLYAGILLLLW